MICILVQIINEFYLLVVIKLNKMSQLHKSTPKMRKAFTPRVKSAQIIDDNGAKKALYFSNKKNGDKDMINPEKVNNHLAKKLNLNVQNERLNTKFDIANFYTDTDSPAKRNNLIENNLKVGDRNNIRNDNKQKIEGRIKQWPHNNNKYNNPNNRVNNQNLKEHLLKESQHNQKQFGQNKQQEQNYHKSQMNIYPSRCKSAHTFKSTQSVVFSQKSSKIKQQKQQFQQKFNVAFNYLLRSNSEYLRQKLSMCNQKSRPIEQVFKINRPKINTTNSDFYKVVDDKHKLDIEPQNQKMSLLLSHSKVCGNSMNQQIHSGKTGKKADLAAWGQGFKLQGPIYSVTNKQSAYPNHGNFDKMVPIAVWNQHPLGMKHKQCSTSSKFFKGQFVPRAELATWNNLNPVANDLFNPKKDTFYSKQFDKKERQPIQQWPMAEHKLIVTDGKFSTQFRDSLVNFNNHELNDQNHCKCGRKRH